MEPHFIVFVIFALGYGLFALERGLREYRNPTSLRRLWWGYLPSFNRSLFGDAAGLAAEKFLQDQQAIRRVAATWIFGGVVFIIGGCYVLFELIKIATSN